MLTELCGELNNYFDRDMPNYIGEVTISNGMFAAGKLADLIQNGQYFRIVGSVFNDGVYKYNGGAVDGLVDEVFNGSVRLMAVPKEVVTLAQDIAAWVDKYGKQAMSPFASESLSASSYSYSKATISADGTGGASWQASFAKRLKRWRKTRP